RHGGRIGRRGECLAEVPPGHAPAAAPHDDLRRHHLAHLVPAVVHPGPGADRGRARVLDLPALVPDLRRGVREVQLRLRLGHGLRAAGAHRRAHGDLVRHLRSAHQFSPSEREAPPEGWHPMKKLNSIILHVGLILIGIVTVFPFVWMVLSAFKPNSEIRALDQTFLPKEWTFKNFQNIQQTFDFMRLFGNSVFLAAAITAIAIYTSVLTGFVLGKYVFHGRGALFGFILGTMMIPWAV